MRMKMKTPTRVVKEYLYRRAWQFREPADTQKINDIFQHIAKQASRWSAPCFAP